VLAGQQMTGASAAQLLAYDAHKHILICHSEIQPTNSSSLNQSMLDTINNGHRRKEQKIAARSKHSSITVVGWDHSIESIPKFLFTSVQMQYPRSMGQLTLTHFVRSRPDLISHGRILSLRVNVGSFVSIAGIMK
jgi:hypothetical protein